MAISYINTTEVENISNEIVSLANEFENEINNLFNRFSEVPNVTGEWVGNQSQYYFNTIKGDKKMYKDFASKIREIGYKLGKDAHDAESCIKKNISEESPR